MKNAFILFTRLPIPGQTKTRLEKFISKDKCANLHKSMLKDIGKTLESVDADIFIFYTPNGSPYELKKILGDKYPYVKQSGKDIWKRMENALEIVLLKNYDKVILTGADIPSIDCKHINDSFKSLVNSDVVITPTYDDGYCLIGMKKLYRSIFNIYDKIDTLGVFNSTINAIKSCDLNVFINDKILDIDEEEDILSIINNYYNNENCTNTITYLKSIGY